MYAFIESHMINNVHARTHMLYMLHLHAYMYMLATCVTFQSNKQLHTPLVLIKGKSHYLDIISRHNRFLRFGLKK